jgi:FAD/FMN-containing dehydrogenase
MQAFIVLAAWLLTGAPSTQAQDQDNHDYTAEATFSLNDPWSSSDMMTTCCSELSNILPDRVFFPGSDIYDQSENSYYCANTREIRPNCILRPQSTQEISAAIRLLSSKLSDQDSAPSDCQFGVRGGVHTAWKGANNIESGVTIDLSQLTDIQLSPDRSIVTVEGGSTWDQVYKYLEGYKLGTLGGRVTGIGVGGLTLGGGISFFSARYGFVCDNLESIELVMADGKVENVSSTAHPDLFRALKGGSNNFGVVTKFRMRTFPSGEFWGGQVYYNMSTVDQQLAAFEKVVGSPDFDPYAAMIHSYAWSAEMSIVVTMFTHTKVPASDSVPEFLSEMVNIPNMGTSASSHNVR